VTAPVAALDCGTNSTRLLVADATGRPLERLMTITRLGQGVDATGRLAPDAIARTADVLRGYRRVMDRHGVGRARLAATSAARDAGNRDEFFVAARAASGVEPELLSGEEEGRLAFAGATRGLDPVDGPFLVVDIGGGSTEVVFGTTEPVGARSMEIGCVRLTEKYLASDPPAAEELSDALVEVRDQLEDTARELPESREARTMVGLAGTITTVAAVEIGLATYDRDRIHHFILTRTAAEDVFRTLATERRADRIHNPGLEEARADVIVGGCAVLVGLMRFFDFESCLVSEADILDGMVFDLLS
jgi:exopolyphosphatase/guanosine-5'-triphosphate,3'-diphosphate pyrophosphatase